MGKQIFGFVLLLFGLLLLAGNLRWFDPSFMFSLLQFWPLLLITSGLNLLFRKTALGRVGTVTLALFLIGMLGLGMAAKYYLAEGEYWTVGPWHIGSAGITVSDYEQITKSESYKLPDRVSSARYEIDFGAGTLRLQGFASDKYLLKTEFTSAESAMPSVEIEDARDAVVEIDQRGRGWMPFSGRFAREEWTLSLNDTVTTQLDVNTGASDVELDLARVPVESLDLNTGASKVQVTFGQNVPRLEANIKTGASTLTLRIPEGMAVLMNFDGGLTSLSVPEDFDKLSSGQYESENYSDKAAYQLILDIDSGADRIKLERYDAEATEEEDSEEDTIDDEEGGEIDFDRLTGGAMNPIGYDKVEPAVFVVADYLASNPEASRLSSILDVYRRPGQTDAVELLILQGQKNTGGYAITTDSVRVVEDVLRVEVTLREPSRDDIVTQALTSPYEVISLAKADLPTTPFRIEIVNTEGELLASTEYGDLE